MCSVGITSHCSSLESRTQTNTPFLVAAALPPPMLVLPANVVVRVNAGTAANSSVVLPIVAAPVRDTQKKN